MVQTWTALVLVCAALVAHVQAGSFLLQMSCNGTGPCSSLVTEVVQQLLLANTTNNLNKTVVSSDILINDFNECGQNKSVCSPHAKCINQFRTYTCQCLSGFLDQNPSQPGTNCTDIDECSITELNNCSAKGICTNNVGGYSCRCGIGFEDTDRSNPGTVCQDIDECSGAFAGLCPLIPHSKCINTLGGFGCVCDPGYVDVNPHPILATCIAATTVTVSTVQSTATSNAIPTIQSTTIAATLDTTTQDMKTLSSPMITSVFMTSQTAPSHMTTSITEGVTTDGSSPVASTGSDTTQGVEITTPNMTVLTEASTVGASPTAQTKSNTPQTSASVSTIQDLTFSTRSSASSTSKINTSTQAPVDTTSAASTPKNTTTTAVTTQASSVTNTAETSTKSITTTQSTPQEVIFSTVKTTGTTSTNQLTSTLRSTIAESTFATKTNVLSTVTADFTNTHFGFTSINPFTSFYLNATSAINAHVGKTSTALIDSPTTDGNPVLETSSGTITEQVTVTPGQQKGSKTTQTNEPANSASAAITKEFGTNTTVTSQSIVTEKLTTKVPYDETMGSTQEVLQLSTIQGSVTFNATRTPTLIGLTKNIFSTLSGGTTGEAETLSVSATTITPGRTTASQVTSHVSFTNSGEPVSTVPSGKRQTANQTQINEQTASSGIITSYTTAEKKQTTTVPQSNNPNFKLTNATVTKSPKVHLTDSTLSLTSSSQTNFGSAVPTQAPDIVLSTTTAASKPTISPVNQPTVNPGTSSTLHTPSSPFIDTGSVASNTSSSLSATVTAIPSIPRITVPVTQENIAQVASDYTSQVLAVRADANSISADDGAVLVSNLMMLVGGNVSVNEKVAMSVLQVVDLLGSSTTVFASATANNITLMVDNLLNTMVLVGGSFQGSFGSLTTGARDVNGSVNIVLPSFSLDSGFTSTSTRNSAQITLPSNIFADTSNQERVSFTGYVDARLFRTSSTDAIMNGSFARPTKSSVINSAVVGSSVAGRSIQNLNTPVEISLPLAVQRIPTETQSNSTTVITSLFNPRCVYFDYNLDGGNGDWSQDGCVTSQSASGSVTCQCSHLTSFAVIMSVETTVDDYILNILTYTGCALSIFGLSLTIVTYTIFKHLRKYKSKRILTHFCFALCGVYIAFLVGIAAHAPSNQSQCIASGFFMHFFTAATFSWMLVEVVDMYLMFVKVWVSVRHYVRKASMFGWGFPLLLSIATLAAHFGLQETYPGSDWFRMYPLYRETVVCWLSPFAVYYTFLAPLGLILIFNTVLFTIVLYNVTCRRTGRKLTRVRSNAKKVKGRQHVLNAMAILLLTGPTWLIGFLINVDPIEDGVLRRILAYVFVVLNAFQGLWIFIVFTIRPRVVRSSWINLLFKSGGLDQTRSQNSSSGRRGTRNSAATTRTNTQRRKSSLDVRRCSTPSVAMSVESPKSPLTARSSSSSSNPSVVSEPKSPVQYRYTKDPIKTPDVEKKVNSDDKRKDSCYSVAAVISNGDSGTFSHESEPPSSSTTSSSSEEKNYL